VRVVLEIFNRIPTLTLPFSRGGDTVEPGSMRFPPLEKGRVRVGIRSDKLSDEKRIAPLFLPDGSA
jgi:hypothetical protein